jgi:hypothetical protein
MNVQRPQPQAAAFAFCRIDTGFVRVKSAVCEFPHETTKSGGLEQENRMVFVVEMQQ